MVAGVRCLARSQPIALRSRSSSVRAFSTYPQIVPTIIGGEKFTSTATEFYDVHNPATQELLCRTPQNTPAELDRAYAAAEAAFPAWSNTPVSVRARHMQELARLIRRDMDVMADIVSDELGKTTDDAKGSIFRGLEVVEHSMSIPSLMMGETTENVASNVDTYSFRTPLGVCAGICPFNFPAMIPMWMFPMSITCGNTYVLKPSERVPLTTVKLMELVKEAGVPDGVVNMVHGGRPTVESLCQDSRIRAISFVGSNQAGESIYANASKNGKRVQSNMGAKNHCIVLPDADKEDTLNMITNAAFGAAGQRCMALSVVILVGDTQSWIPDLVAKAKELKCGQGQEPGVHFGPLVTPAAKDRVIRLVRQGVNDGAKMELDGTGLILPNYPQGNFVGATVVSGVSASNVLATDELFGPVLSVMQVPTYDDALKIVNDNPWGNGTALFTSSGVAARKFQHEVEAGQIGINLPLPVPLPMFSFTGGKKSMWGDLNFYGKAGVQFFTKWKTITARWREGEASRTVLSGAFPTMK